MRFGYMYLRAGSNLCHNRRQRRAGWREGAATAEPFPATTRVAFVLPGPLLGLAVLAAVGTWVYGVHSMSALETSGRTGAGRPDHSPTSVRHGNSGRRTR
jgi:hypothetical protein